MTAISTNTIQVAHLRETLADVLKRAGDDKERVIVTRHGHRHVAIIPIEDLQFIERLEGMISGVIASQIG